MSERLSRLSLVAALGFGLLVGIGQAMGLVFHPIDALIYWRQGLDHLYTGWGTESYLYPPPFAQLLAVAHGLPWEVFIVGWTTLLFGCLWYCARWATLPIIAAGLVGLAGGITPLWAPLDAVLLGNVTMLLAAAAVAGMRHPEAWALPLLGKVTVGVGVLYLPVRGIAWAVAVTAAVAGGSFALAPGLWFDWFRFATSTPLAASPVPVVGWLPVRLAAAVGLVLLARVRRWPWLVPAACGLANPALYGWEAVLPYAIAGIALLPKQRAEDADRRLERRVTLGVRGRRETEKLPSRL